MRLPEAECAGGGGAVRGGLFYARPGTYAGPVPQKAFFRVFVGGQESRSEDLESDKIEDLGDGRVKLPFNFRAKVKARGAIIDYEPCDQPYGCREFGIKDPDGHDIAFGQDLEPRGGNA